MRSFKILLFLVLLTFSIQSFALFDSCQELLTLNLSGATQSVDDLATEYAGSPDKQNLLQLVSRLLDDSGVSFDMNHLTKVVGEIHPDADGTVRADLLAGALRQLDFNRGEISYFQRIISRLSVARDESATKQNLDVISAVTEGLTKLNLVREPTSTEKFLRTLRRRTILAAIVLVSSKFGGWVTLPWSAPLIIDEFVAPSELNSASLRSRLWLARVMSGYRVLMTATVLSLAVARPHLFFLPIETALVSSHAVSVQKDKIFSDPVRENNERQKVFDSWREAFALHHNGRDPDPVLDKVEWDKNWNAAFKEPVRTLRGE